VETNLVDASGLKHAARGPKVAHESVQCGPQTSGKMKILKEILGGLFSQKHWVLTQKKFFII